MEWRFERVEGLGVQTLRREELTTEDAYAAVRGSELVCLFVGVERRGPLA